MSIIKLIINLRVLEKMWTKNGDRKQYKKHERSFITTDAIELLIFQKDLKNVDQFRSCFLQVLHFDDSTNRNGILLSEEQC